MDSIAPAHAITSIADLEAIYGAVSDRAKAKVIHRLDETARRFIAASPFMLLATQGEHGGDCSPRGDEPGFVRVADDKTLMFADRKGNNRVDSLRNIVANPTVALLFLVPGANETFRLNGRAHLTTDPALMESFAHKGKLPQCVVVVHVDEAFMQCGRAVLRADLWNPEQRKLAQLAPTAGEMLASHTTGLVEAQAYDAYVRAQGPETLY